MFDWKSIIYEVKYFMLPGEVQSDDLVGFPLNEVSTAGVGRVPVGHGQEDAFRVSRGLQVLTRQQPVTRAIPTSGRFHVSRPVAHVEMEARVEQWTYSCVSSLNTIHPCIFKDKDNS